MIRSQVPAFRVAEEFLLETAVVPLVKNIRLFGPHVGRAGLVSFLLNGVHAHDVTELANQRGIALRGGHHCTQALMHKLGVESTSRASFYFYNTTEEIDRLVEVLKEIQKFFGE